MKAVVRLVFSYFTGTTLHRSFTIGGLVVIVIAGYILTTRAQSGEMLWVAMLGFIALFVGGSLMPLIFGRLAHSHAIRVLPYGRLKLLLSAFITVLLVSTPVALLAPIALVAGNSGNAADLVKHRELLEFSIQFAQSIFTASILFTGWLYLAIWFVASQRDMAGLFKGLVVIVLLLFAPIREIQELELQIEWHVQQIVVVWLVFGAGFLLWPRIMAAVSRRTSWRFPGFGGGSRDISGQEFDLMLGTENPWKLIAALVLPVVIVTRFVNQAPAVWLYFLTIFSAVVGAFAGQAAERSRALWLRGDWTREALFSGVERSIWRHNGYVLGCLLLLMVAIGSHAGFSVQLLAAGLPLLVLGTVLSTYLGLMITRGLRWIEAALGVVVMLGLMTVAVAALENVNLLLVLGAEAVFAMLAVALRFEARRRWLQIDWMMCRRDRSLSVRGAS